MTWLLVIVWILGGGLFAFSFWIFGLAAMRMISGRRRTRIWHGQVAAPPSGPLRPRVFTSARRGPSWRHRHRARPNQPANGGRP